MSNVPAWVEYVTAFGTAGAAIAAAWAAIASSRSTGQTKRLVDVELARRGDEQRAANTAGMTAAYFRRRPETGSVFAGFQFEAWLALYNAGPATASEVRLTQSGQREKADIDTSMIPTVLMPGQQVRVWVTSFGGGEALGRVAILYRDGNGEHELAVHPEMLDG